MASQVSFINAFHNTYSFKAALQSLNDPSEQVKGDSVKEKKCSGGRERETLRGTETQLGKPIHLLLAHTVYKCTYARYYLLT